MNNIPKDSASKGRATIPPVRLPVWRALFAFALVALMLPWSATPVEADGAVGTGANFATARDRTSAVWDGTNAYIFGGYGSSALDDIIRYTPSTNTLAKLTAVLPSHRYGTSAIWDGSNAYVFGGILGTGGYTNQVVKFAPATNTATVVASLPSARAYTSAIWDGSSAYIFGGLLGTGTHTNQVIKFTPATNAVFTMSAILPSARAEMGAVWDGAGNAYLLGGRSYDGFFQDVLRYIPATNTLTTMNSVLPRPVYAAATAWDGTGNAYLFGGNSDQTDNLADVVHYTPSTGAVGQGSDLPVGRSGSSAVWVGSNGYIFGGSNEREVLRYSRSAPLAPTLAATSGADAITLSWQPGSDGGLPVTSYQVHRGATSGSETLVTTGGCSNLGNVLTCTDSGLGSGQTRFYTVQAVNSLGVGSQSNEASATTFQVPGAPGNLEATDGGPSAGGELVTLHWSAPSSTGGSTISGYALERGFVSGGETSYQAVAANRYSYSDNCPYGRNCYYTVRAVNAAGAGPQSNEAAYEAVPVTEEVPEAPDDPVPGAPNAPDPPSTPQPDANTTVTVIPGAAGAPTAVRTVGRPVRIVEQVDTALVILAPSSEPQVVPLGLNKPCDEDSCPKPCDFLDGVPNTCQNPPLDSCDYLTLVPGVCDNPDLVVCEQPALEDNPPCQPVPPPPTACPNGAQDCVCEPLVALSPPGSDPCAGDLPCSPAVECMPCDPGLSLLPSSSSDCTETLCPEGGVDCLEACEGHSVMQAVECLAYLSPCEDEGFDCVPCGSQGGAQESSANTDCLPAVCEGPVQACVPCGDLHCVNAGCEEEQAVDCLLPERDIDLRDCTQAQWLGYAAPDPSCAGIFDVLFAGVQGDMMSLSILIYKADELMWQGSVDQFDGDHAILEDVPVILDGEYSLGVAQAGQMVLRAIDPLFEHPELSPPEWSQTQASSSESECYSNHTGITEEEMETGKNTYAGEYYMGGNNGQRRFMVAGWYNKWYYRDTCGYGYNGVGQYDMKAGLAGRYDIDVGETHTVTNLVGFSGSSDRNCYNYGSSAGTKCHGHEVVSRDPTVFINRPEHPSIRQRGVALFDEDPNMSCKEYRNSYVDLGVDLVMEAFEQLAFLKPMQLIYGFVPEQVCQVPYKLVDESVFTGNAGMGIRYNKEAFDESQRVQAGGISTYYGEAFPYEIAMEVEISVKTDAWFNACDWCGWVGRQDTVGMSGAPTVKVEPVE